MAEASQPAGLTSGAPSHVRRRPLGRSLLLTLGGLVLVLAVAAPLRLSGRDWDQGHNQHPDERFIVMVTQALQLPKSPIQFFDTSSSPLNPYNRGFEGFAYGTLPVFVVKALALALKVDGFQEVTILGRTVSALFDLGTVALVFLLGSYLFGRVAGVLAGLFSGLAVLQIQLAHFYTVDSFLGFFTALALLFAYRTWRRGTYLDAGMLGVAVGLAEATKISGALLLPIAFLACVLDGDRDRKSAERPWMGLLAVSFGVAFLAFRIGEPYAFLGPSPLGIRPNMQFVEDMIRWVKISSGEIEVPYMIQWARTQPYVYPLQILVIWGLGVPLGVVSLGGLLIAAFDLRHWPARRTTLLLVLWTALCLGYFGGQFAKFLRYMIPVYPALAILAGYALWRLWQTARGAPARYAGVFRALVLGTGSLVVVFTAWYAVAFTTLYVRPHSRVLASEWIYANVPPGSTLATEHWDDRLPFPLQGDSPEQYQYTSLNLYDDESPAKAQQIAASLTESDYVILASYRLAGSIPRLPERYPLATAYYDMLFKGELGYEQAAVLSQHPSFLGISIDDTWAPEDLTVYEHPTVTIFRKTAGYDPAVIAARLAEVPTSTAVRVAPLRAGQGTLLLSQAQQVAVEASGTWSALFHRESLANQAPLLFWLVLLEMIGLAAFPLLWLLLTRIPDRGWSIAKVVGLVVVAYVGWLLQSVGAFRFGPLVLLLALAILAGGSAVVATRRQHQLVTWIRKNWPQILIGEVIFLAAFGVMLLVRLLNPDLWHPSYGGEKPMDFAYFNAVLKSPVFPPYDPWFAGGYINYYYYGFVLAAVPTRLLGIVPSVAFNLLIPTFYALLSAACAGFVWAVVAPRPYLLSRRGRALGLAAALSGTLLVAFLGDLDGMLQLVQGLSKLAPELPATAIPVVGPLLRTLAGIPMWTSGKDLAAFDFWRPTRVIGPEEPGPITEFPFFTFLYGDLHAHLLALPLTVSVLVLALNTARTRVDVSRLRFAPESLRALAPLLPLLGLLALFVGSLRATNTWDFPVYLLIGALGLALSVRPRDWRHWQRSATAAVGLAAGLFIGSSLLFAPYLRGYQLFYTGFDPSPATTDVGQFLTVHGLNLFLVLSSLLLEAALIFQVRRPGERLGPRQSSPMYGLAIPAPALELGGGVSIVASIGVISLGIGMYLVGQRSAGLLLGCLALLPLLVMSRRFSAAGLFGLGAIGLALLALLLPELVTLQGDVGRMNTVFKFHLQAWVLLGLFGAAGLAHVLRRASFIPRHLWVWKDAWGVALAVLVVSALTYPLLATPVKTGFRFADAPAFGTLDGMAFMGSAAYRDREKDIALPADFTALRWMQDHVVGTPVVAEGNAGLYKWGSRVSIYTGLPTIIGWDWHQKQQRWGYQSMVDARLRDVQTLYETTDMAAAWPILSRYHVRFVYVGGLERAYYPPAGLAKLDQALGQGLTLVYDAGGVRIYQVDRAAEAEVP